MEAQKVSGSVQLPGFELSQFFFFLMRSTSVQGSTRANWVLGAHTHTVVRLEDLVVGAAKAVLRRLQAARDW